MRQAAPYLPGEIAYDPDAVAKQWKDRAATAELLHAVQRPARERCAAWTPESLEEALRALATQRGVAAGKLFQPLRVALTGLTVSPGIFDVLDRDGARAHEQATARRVRVPEGATA